VASVWQCWRPVAAALLLSAAYFAIPAHAQTLPQPAAAHPDICDADDDDDDDGKSAKPVPLWKRFAWEGACVKISGTLSGVYQKQKASANRIPILSSRQGGVLTGVNQLGTLDASLRIDTERKLGTGTLSTGFEVQYERTTADTGIGALTLTEWINTWDFEKRGSLNVGYTDSQMNYWAGDFQFTATAPSRTVGLAGYTFVLTDTWSFSLAYETGVPTSRAGANDFAPLYFDDPVGSVKLAYEKDDTTFQLSGMIHQLKISGSNPFLSLLEQPGEPFRKLGWAVTAGLTLPVKLGEDGSEFSAQATYAVNASPYLGTAADASGLAGSIGAPITTQGWSVVGSYHHVFSDYWEANVMASHLALDISFQSRQPSLRTTRYAANLIYKPVEGLKIGAEAGYLQARYETAGLPGIFNPRFLGQAGTRPGLLVPAPALNTGARGIKGDGLVGYLFVTYEF
jgi:hypothetical protein